MHCLRGILIPVSGIVTEPVTVHTSPSRQPHLCKCCKNVTVIQRKSVSYQQRTLYKEGGLGPGVLHQTRRTPAQRTNVPATVFLYKIVQISLMMN